MSITVRQFSAQVKDPSTGNMVPAGLLYTGQDVIRDWLDEHPEATTTVQDGSLTEAKFSDALKLATVKDYVTPEMYGAKGDGVTDDTAAFQQLNGKLAFIGAKTYIVENLEYGARTHLIGAGQGKTRLKLKPNASVKRVLSMVNAYESRVEGLTLDGNKENQTGAYDTYDAVFTLRTTSTGSPMYLSYSTFENIGIEMGGNYGFAMPRVSGNPDYNWNWCYHCNNFFIRRCRVGVLNMGSDNEFSNFYVTGSDDAGFICKGSSSNKYVNFKLEGTSGQSKTSISTPSEAILVFDGAHTEMMTNLDIQSAAYHGIKVINAKNISLRGICNNCGIAYSSSADADKDGIGMSFYNSHDCSGDFVFNIATNAVPVQRTNVIIDSTCKRIAVEYIADPDNANLANYPCIYTNNGVASTILRKDHKLPIAVVTGITLVANGYSTAAAYPDGFTASNCIPILTIQSDGLKRNGPAILAAEEGTRTFATITNSGVQVYNSNSALEGAKGIVTLIRIS